MVTARCIASSFIGPLKKAMATPRMNDPIWVAGLARAKATTKYEFVGIHVLAPLRNQEGVAPVVLQAREEYWRAPAPMEAAFELCLRHLNRLSIPWPDQGNVTPQALLANRAMEALKLPGKYVPTAEGKVIVMESSAKCHAACQAGPLQEASSATVGTSSAGAEQMAAQPEATTPTPRDDGQYAAELRAKAVESDADGENYHKVRGPPYVDAAVQASGEGETEGDMEQATAFPMHASQPDDGSATAKSPSASKPEGETEDVTEGPPSVAESEGEAEQAGVEPSTVPSDGEEKQVGADPSSPVPAVGDVAANEARKPPVSTLSKKARRRAAQKARKRGG